MDVKEKELEKNENSENLSYQDNVENKKENKEENLNLIPSQDSDSQAGTTSHLHLSTDLLTTDILSHVLTVS